jgi:hypothetical protein
MSLSGHQNRDIKIPNTSFENVAQFKSLGMIVTNQNLIQKEIWSKMNLAKACYHSVQNLFFSSTVQKYKKLECMCVKLSF